MWKPNLVCGLNFGSLTKGHISLHAGVLEAAA